MPTFTIYWTNVLSNGTKEQGTQLVSGKTKEDAERVFKSAWKGTNVKVTKTELGK